MSNEVDIRENNILLYDPQVFSLLLIDRSKPKCGDQPCNIIWATDNYKDLGAGYGEWDEITADAISGKNGLVLRPRVNKSREEQEYRSRDKAEVFTAAWICNKQNNLIDAAWFGGEEAPFNIETENGWETKTAPRESIKLHKVYFPEAGGSGTDTIVLGRPFYGEPNSVCSQTYLVVGYDPNKHNFTAKECEHIIVYMRTRFLRYLVSIKKTTQHNPSNVFQFVPLQDWSKPWTDGELYAKYNLSSDEIAYIESMIKPMADDALFSTEATLDPECGNFNLQKYEVKPGDTITYTPSKMEVTVLEDNKVAYGGEEYTLAEFTAENMPRNKRSISGVCQGPKYFSKGGVSLYKLKESFLGGKKK